MNNDDLRGLVDRATFFHERLDETWQPTPHPFDAEIVDRRLARWCRLAAGGDWDRFAQRLSWDGLRVETVRPLLGTGRHVLGTPLPDWASFLAQVIDATGDHPVLDIAGYFVDAAQQRLAHQDRARLAWFSPFAQQSLTAYLAERLNVLIRAALVADPEQSLSAHCLRYPVSARQLAQCTLDWTAEVTDFLARLAEDWPMLAQHADLPSSPTPGIVSAVRLGLSDPHRGGRTVWRIDLDGVAVAYKPKNMQMDKSWAGLVKWATSHGLDAAPGHLWVIARGDHGWMEWAQPTPQPDAHRLAQNVGGLLALLHLVHAADCHAENLAAREDAPLLLDAEMLVYPQFGGHEDGDPLDVTRTGLLPRWSVDGSQQDGIGSLFGQVEEIPTAQVIAGYRSACDWLATAWSALDEDGVLARLRRGTVRIAPRPTAAYLRLLAHLRHPAFLADGIDFSIEADRLAYTYLHRPDQERFASLLRTEHRAIAQGDVPLFHGEVDHPDFVDAQGALPGVGKTRQEKSRPGGLTADHPPRADLPGFLQPGGSPVPRLLWPSFTLPSSIDRIQQAGLIQAGLDRLSYTTGISQTFIDAARHLGDLLAQRAIPTGGEGRIERKRIERGLVGLGGLKRISRDLDFNPSDPPNPLNPRSIPPLTWIAVQYQPRSGLWRHRLVGKDLYAGRAGIGLFLAALAHVTSEAGWRDLALAGFAAHAATPPAPPDWAGRVYALSVAADLLQEPALRRQAEALALSAAETPPQGTPHPWGVLDGGAGDVLALLKLHAQTDDARWLVRAARLGEAILRAADTWTHPDRALGGYSHGAAGIADTLLRLHHATEDDNFLAGAARAWDVQQSLFDEPPGNWQDRRGETPVYLRNWCNGAAGIGLAGATGSASFPHLRPLVERAAALLTEDHPTTLDTLCCGQFGQIESLLEMGLLQNRQDWVEQASVQARCVLSHTAQSGAFQLYDDLPAHLFNPGFFRGVAGIGYTLLRLAAVNGEWVGELPCVMRNA